MYFEHKICRACKGTNLHPVFDLGVQPMANNFIATGEEREGWAPLRILLCGDCTLAQISVVVKPHFLYKSYAYVTSRSETMAKHFQVLCDDIVAESGLGAVLEIGSNDGFFMDYLGQCGFDPVIGVDPSENLKRSGRHPTCERMWDTSTAEQIRKMSIGAPIDIIIARHCFCHIDDWHEFVAACDVVAHKDTLICIEVPYVPDMLYRTELDQCYHEHLSFFTLKAMSSLLFGTNWHMHKVIRYAIHGGAVLVMLRHDDYADGLPDISVNDMLEQETESVTGRLAWREFNDRAREVIRQLRETVMKLVADGKTICMFGASAKSTVWLNACGLASEEWIDFITDTTPEKIGRLSPGTNIPIVAESELLVRQPDYAIMTCWNFFDECMAKNKEYLARGGKFIVPVPELRIIGA